MSPRSLLLVGGVLLFGSGQAARAEYQWTGPVVFTDGPRLSSGGGTFTFGLDPNGPGGAPGAVADQSNGYEAARGYVIRYTTVDADAHNGAVITWTVDRNFSSVALPSYTTISLTFRAELGSEGDGLTLAYEAETRHLNFGGPSVVSVSDSFELAPGNAVRDVSAPNTSGIFTPTVGPDSLRQTVQFTINPSSAGQVLSIYFDPNGAISTGNNVGDVNAVPAPPALVLCLSAVPVLGAMGLRAGRRKLA